MKLERMGPEGVMARIQELRGRMTSLRGTFAADGLSFAEVTDIAPQAPPISGPIGKNAPLDPMGPGFKLSGGPSPELRDMIARAANEVGVDAGLLTALVESESGFNPAAVSAKGALGLTQLMPSTARSLGVDNPLDPWQNLQGGAKYLQQMLTQFPDLRTALAAYNAGPGAVTRYGGVPPFPETRSYVDRIMARLGVR